MNKEKITFFIPEHFAISVARNSDIGFTCGFTISAQNNADKLLKLVDSVLKYTVK